MHTKVYEKRYVQLIKIQAPGLFLQSRQSQWGGWPTRRCLVFCCHLDNFIMTRNFLPSIGTGKKLGTATQTATNQTAGLLAARQIAAKLSLYLDFRRTSKSFAALPCNRPFAAKHMLFCLPRLSRLDNFIIP
jgi:hypothetical protein